MLLGICVNDYMNKIAQMDADRKSDAKLIKRLRANKRHLKKQKRNRKQYKQSLREKAKEERSLKQFTNSLMNMES